MKSFLCVVVALAVFSIVNGTNQQQNYQNTRKSNRVNLLSQAVGARLLAGSNPNSNDMTNNQQNNGFVPIPRSIPPIMDLTTSTRNMPVAQNMMSQMMGNMMTKQTNNMNQQQQPMMNNQMGGMNGQMGSMNSQMTQMDQTNMMPPQQQQLMGNPMNAPMGGQMNQQVGGQMNQQMGGQQMNAPMGNQMMNQQMPVGRAADGGMCADAKSGDIVPNPSNPTQFVICYGFGEFTVMDCPDHLVYNPHLVRCDLVSTAPPGCSSNPCLNNGKCIDLPQLFTFRCECPAGFTGQTCDKSDACASKPCGPDGVCISMATGSPIPNACVCNSGRTIGGTCNQQNVEMNPCFQPNTNLRQFPTRINPSVFIHCEGLRPNFVFCQFPLVFSPSRQICDWTA